jgi:gliding motility-associated-like protein
MKKLILLSLFVCSTMSYLQAQVAVSATATGVSCAGVCDGTVTLTISGGVGPYDIFMTDGLTATYTDTTALTNITYTDICKANPLTVLITDLGNGDLSGTSVIVSGPNAILLAASPVRLNTTCKDSCKGRITAIFSGDGPLNYTWSNGLTGSVNSFAPIINNNLCADTFSVIITDANLCSKTFTYLSLIGAGPATVGSNFIVTEPNYIVSSFTVTNASCNATCDGALTALTTGGNGGNLYNWNGTPTGDGTSTITSLCDGQYILTVTDSRGCIGIDTANVTEPSGLTVVPTTSNITCNNGSDGSISLAVGGGIAPYTFTWSPNVSGTNAANNIPAGTYEIIIRDNNGIGTCPDTVEITLTEPGAIDPNETVTDVLCFGGSTGQIALAPTGGSGGGYTYSWSTGSVNDTLYNLTAGTYDVTITDGLFCTQTASIVVDENPEIFSNITSSDVSCNGFFDGSASVAPSGGVELVAHSVLWSTGSSLYTINLLTGGTYTVTITDNVGCTKLDTAVVINPPPFATNFSSTQISCFGASNGSATVSPSGGTLPYSTAWYNPLPFDFDTAVSGLPPGNYTVGIIDGAGCPVTQNFTISQPSAINPDIVQTNNNCFGDCSALATSSPFGGNGGYSFDWSNGPTTPGITNLCAGTYTVTVTDVLLCTGTQTITITEPDSIQLALTNNNASCGFCDGDATTTPIGGTGTLDILWETGSNLNTISALCIGTYSVTITDDNGCTNTDSVDVQTPGNITINPSQTNVTCAGANDGVASVAPTGGIPGYIYAWSNGESTSSITNLAPGNYTVTISDAQPCVLTQDFTILSNTNMLLTGIEDSSSCANICDGIGTVQIAGGLAPYSFAWSFGGTDSIETNLCSGTYDITVTDGNNCTSTTSVTIDPKIIISFGTTLVKLDCNDAFCDGQATGTASGGIPAYSFTWSSGIQSMINATTGLADSVCSGMLYVTVTDQLGCTGEDSIFMVADTNVLQVSIIADSISCNGANDGELTAIGVGGPTPYTYLWDTGDITQTISNLVPGTYSVTITDTNNCRVDTSFTLTDPQILDVSLSKIDILCNGSADGQIDASVVGGTVPYQYTWSNTQITEDLTNLLAGTYTLTVTDFHGCTDDATITIIEPLPITNVFTSTNASCNLFCDGQAMVNPTGGANSFTYQWDINTLFQTTQTATSLCAGEYFVTITDTNLCAITDSITITEPIVLSAIMSSTPITCYADLDGSATATPSGGTGPFSYEWSINTGSQTNQTAVGLGDGTYDVTVTDNNNCTATNSIILVEPDTISIDITVNNVACFGSGNGSIDALGSGGTGALTYLWDAGTGSQATPTASNLAPGTYTVTVTDQNGCSNEASGTVNTPQPLQGSPFSSAANCNLNDGTARVFPLIGGVPPYQHHWNTGQVTALITNLPGGLIYTDTITDALGCQLIVDVPVSEIGGPTSVTVLSSNASCFNACNGGAVSGGIIGGTAPYTYLWDDIALSTTPSVSNLCAGSYLLLVTDNIGCSTFSPPILVSEPDSLVANITITNATCEGFTNGEIAANPSGGTGPYTFLWSNGASGSSVTGLGEGTYSVDITDINGCMIQENNIALTDFNTLSTTISTTDVACFGDSTGIITLTPAGGSSPYTYAWDATTGNQSASAASQLSFGTYSVTITDNNGCSMDTVASIAENIALSLSANVTHTLCGLNTGEITITPNGGIAPYTITWLHNGSASNTISSLTAGIYGVEIEDQSNCTDTFYIVVNNSDGPVINALIQNISCNGSADGSAHISASGGTGSYSYLWNPTLQTDSFITNAQAGTYFIEVTDGNGCNSLDTIIISEPLPIQINLTPNPPSCFGFSDGGIIANATQGTAPYTYEWTAFVNDPFISGISAGSYTITVTDGNNCSNTASINLTQPSDFTGTETTQNVSCFAGTNGQANLAYIGGTAPYDYAWSNGSIASTITNLTSGQYDYTITDANGCTLSDSVLISQPSTINIVSATNNTFCGICIGSVTNVVSGGVSPYFYQWSPGGSVSANASNLCAGVYQLTVTDHQGCEMTKVFSIINNDGPQASIPNDTLDCYNGNDGALTAAVVGGTAPYQYAWNDLAQQTNATANNLSSGTYQVIVTDNTGCAGVASGKVINPTDISITQSILDLDCNVLCDVQATVTPIGGSAPYIYAWPGGQNTSTVNGLCAGDYIVTVTDNNGCSKTELVTIQDASTLSIQISSNDITCNGDGNGNALVTVQGGSPGYVYNWNNGFGTNFISSLAPGTYTVSVTDQAGCQRVSAVTFTEPDVLSVILSKQDLACNGIPSGSASALASGGTVPYQYNWFSSGATSASASNLSSGYHYVTITDIRGCSINDSILLNEPAALQLNATYIEPNCNANNGSITLTPSGGAGPYTYTWLAIGQNDSIADNIAAGTYLVTITDQNGCSEDTSIALGNADGPTVDLTVFDVTCGNINDGMIIAEPSGGTLPYIYEWSNTSTNDTAMGLVAGIYFVTVTDGTNCITIATDTVLNSVNLTVDVTLSDVSCNSPNDGSITLNVSGGTSPYTYTWAPIPDVTSSVSNLFAGTYYVTINDQGVCSYVDSFVVNQADPISLTAIVTPNICFGDAIASIVVTGTGGVQPLNYAWSNGDLDQTVDNLTGGTFTVTITDQGNCTFDSVFTLIDPAQITAVLTYAEATCTQSDGSITVTPSGGTGSTYSYLWNGGTATGQTTSTVTTLLAGIYQVSVTDSLGCESSFTAGLNNVNAPDVTLALTHETCLGSDDGTATANIVGGTAPYSLLWSTGDTTLFVDTMSAGEFSLVVTDANGCITTIIDTIEAGSTLTVDVDVTDISCNGGATGQISLTTTGGSGPYDYVWSPIPDQTATVTNLAIGTYYFTVTDQNGCAYNDSAEVDNASPITLIATIDSIECVGGTGGISVIVNGGNAPYTYLWSTGAIIDNISNITANTYSLTVTDASLCAFDTNFVLSNPDSILVDYILLAPTCNNNDGSITANITGGAPGYSITWGGNALGQTGPVANTLFADVYPVTIQDTKGCIVEDSVALSNDTGPIVTLDSLKDVSCFGYNDGYIYLTTSSIDVPLDYAWSSGQITEDLIGIDGGGYSITVTDTVGCATIVLYEIAEPDSFYALITAINPTCYGLCNGMAYAQFFGGTNPFSYQWNDPLAQTNDTAFALCADTFEVFVTDDNFCTTTTQVILTQPDTLVASIDFLQNAVCSESNEGIINISVNGGTGLNYDYAWSGPNGFTANTEDVNSLFVGAYTIQITDSFNCQITLDTAIIANITIQIDSLIATDSLVCLNDLPITLTGYSTGFNLSYSWIYNAASIASDSVTSVSPAVGNHQYIFEINYNGCFDRDTIDIVVEDSPIADAGVASPIIDGLCRDIGGEPTGPIDATYVWSPLYEINDETSPNPQICPDQTTTYYVTVTSANGCVSLDSVKVLVFPEIEFIAGFTNNGDGNNDVWIINNLEDFPDVVVEIYNRWGQKLWESAPGYPTPWDGTYKGNKLPVGTYYYVINLNRPEFPDPITGPLTIVR